MVSNPLKMITKAIAILLVPLALMSACNGCHNPTLRAKVADNIPPAAPIIKGRVLIDPDFSGPERQLIAQGLRMWTDPLADVMTMEISKDPLPELFEAVIHQRLVLEQERAASGIPEPAEDSEEEDKWIDPHSKWDSFDPRTPFWSVDQGCNDRLVILRVTSNSAVIRGMEAGMAAQGHPARLIGHTDNSCHRKAILLVVDRIENSKIFAEVTAHELGHAFGLRHDFEHNASIMFPDNRAPSSCVTRRDVDAFCARWHCAASRPRMVEDKSCGEK